MALRRKLNQIPQKNKDLAFGYLRENEKKHKANYHQLIKYLVLLYSNQQDQFDLNATTADGVIINTVDGTNRFIDIRLKGQFNYNSYLKNIVSEGIHIWKIRWDGNNDCSQIGIWKTKSGEPVIDQKYIDDTTNDGSTCTGYVIDMNGAKTNPSNVSRWGYDDYHDECLWRGDIIEMTLDLNVNTLVFKCGHHEVQFNEIEHTSYRAAITTFERGDGFTILSYQDIYK